MLSLEIYICCVSVQCIPVPVSVYTIKTGEEEGFLMIGFLIPFALGRGHQASHLGARGQFLNHASEVLARFTVYFWGNQNNVECNYWNKGKAFTWNNVELRYALTGITAK